VRPALFLCVQENELIIAVADRSRLWLVRSIAYLWLIWNSNVISSIHIVLSLNVQLQS